MSKEAMKQALEALEKLSDAADGFNVSGVYFNEQLWEKECLDKSFAAITSLSQAIEQAEKQSAERVEPVAFDLQKALRRAYHLGQNYWADADSESYSANKRADKHRQDFDALCEEAVAYTTPPAAPVQELVCVCGAVWQGQELVETPADQRQSAPDPKDRRSAWVGLTDEEIDQGLLRSDYALQTAHAWRAGVVFAMTQLKEKNT